MNVVFYASDKPRELMLANALKLAVKNAKDTFEIRRTGDYGETPDGNDLRYPGPTADTDVACVFGVKGKSRQILNDHWAVAKATLFFDKGYSRHGGEGGHTEYSRISVNASDPLKYMMKTLRSAERFQRLNIKAPKRSLYTRGPILICGSSAKYHEFHGLDDPTAYAEKLIRRIRKSTDRHIIYRPKPSWHDARPIHGTSFSNGSTSMADAMRSCALVVTHGSAAAMEAIFGGVPVIVMGGSIARPVAGTDLEKPNIEDPFWPDDGLLERWSNAMAWQQWTTEELRTGEAWDALRAEIVRQKEDGWGKKAKVK